MVNKEFEKKSVPIDQVLDETGFGLYSVILLITTIAVLTLKIAGLNALNYAIPYAACDLSIDKATHGALNSITYFGEAFCGPIWGTASDRFGRKKVMIVICMLGVICSLALGFSPTASVLLAVCFILGLCIGTLTSLMVTSLCEFHAEKYRATLVMFVGLSNLIANIIFPAIAIGIIPLDFDFPLGSLLFKSWRLYLILTITSPALLGLLFLFLTLESPKYLLANVGHEEALSVMRKVYVWNTRRPPETFPFADLEYEEDTKNFSQENLKFSEKIRAEMQRMAPLFKKPYFNRLLLLLLLFFANGLTGCYLTWMPQYFALQSDYETFYGESKELTVCEIVNTMNSRNTTSTALCSSNLDIDSSRFVNSIIIGCVSLAGNIVATFLLRFIEKNYVLAFSMFSQGFLLLFGVFLPNSWIALTLVVASYLVSLYLILALVTEAFPTSIRAFGVATAAVASQVSPAISNLFLPSWLAYSCQQPFIVFAALNIVTSFGILFIKRILE